MGPAIRHNLLSLIEMIQEEGSTFSGDKYHLTIRNSTGRELLTARNSGNDFRTCSRLNSLLMLMHMSQPLD